MRRTVLTLLASFSPMLAHAQTAPMRTVTDLSGQPVVVPVHPQRIVDLWPAHITLMAMLGGIDRVAVTVDNPRREPWMFLIKPALSRAIQLASPQPTAEALLAAHADLVISPSAAHGAALAAQTGLPVPAIAFHDAPGLMRTVLFTAELLNDPHARAMAARYNAYLAGVLALVDAKTAAIPEAGRPRVLHVDSLHPLRVTGGGVISDWIRRAGGTNAAGELNPSQPVSIEQVAAWNPDVIILNSQAGALDPDADGGLWHTIKAVRLNRVLVNPAGVFDWDRYGAEYPLQLLWAAKALHPELFAATDVPDAARRFFHDYFAYDLTDTELQRILNGERPDGSRPDGMEQHGHGGDQGGTAARNGHTHGGADGNGN